MPKLEELRKFVETDDRGATPIFAGRRAEIEAIARDLRDRSEEWAKGDSDAWDSATRLIQGAPGAGKTATLKHLAKTLPGIVEGLQVCWLESEELGDDTHWKENLGEALIEGAGERLKTTLLLEAGIDAKLVSGGASLSAPLLTWGDVIRRAKASPPSDGKNGESADAGAESRTKIGKKRSMKTLKDAGERVAAAFKGLGSIRPVLLLIDEIQNVPGKKGEPPAAFLSSIHKSTAGLPVFPVYGGLAWSEARLKNLGLTRLSKHIAVPSSVMTLNRLPEPESREVCERFFEHFEILGGEMRKKRWTNEIVRSSLGWPHHLHTHLQSLGHALLRDGLDGDLNSLERAGDDANEAVGEMAVRAREAYYQNRLDHEDLGGRSCLAAVGAAFVAESEDLHVADLGEKIAEVSAEADTARMRLPRGMTGEDFANAMFRVGILHKGPKDILSVPIPSFVDYLKKEYGPGPSANSDLTGIPAAGLQVRESRTRAVRSRS